MIDRDTTPGAIMLTLWLLVIGLDVQRRKNKASAAEERK